MSIIIPKRRQERGGTAADLAAVNEVLMAREWCIETDTGRAKVGDGATAWNALPYADRIASAVTNGDTTHAPSGDAVFDAIAAAVAGLSWKQAVRVATTAAGTLASSFENGDTVDGVVLATGDRILIKNQAAPAANGIYTVNASGSPTRATDADSGAELVNASCYVSEGTTNADTQFVCTTNAPITVGSTAITFVQLSSGSGISALTGDVTASGSGSVAATIANDAVTYAKMQNVSAATRLLGRGSAGGAGDVEEINLSPDLVMSGTTLSVVGGTGSVWAMIKKTSDQSRNTTTTPTDDSALVVALAASTRYRVKWKVFFETSLAAVGFKWSLAYSGTLTKVIVHRRMSTAPGGATSTTNETTSTTNALLTNSAVAGGTSGPGIVELDLLVTTNTTGTLSFQWAQNASNGSDATVLAGSTLEYITA